MLEEAMRLARAGFAIHWLHPKSKAPIGGEWASKPVASIENLKATYKANNNVGVRLGKWSKIGDEYLHAIDLDIRNAAMAQDALDKLAELIPEVQTFPIVQSGSGGESRHFYLLSPSPYPSKKLAHSDSFAMVRDEKTQKDVKKWDWEIEFFGTGKQVAIPPSIHPDTGKAYKWLRQFDFDAVEMGVGPTLSVERIETLIAYEPDVEIDPERAQPLGLTVDETRDLLSKLPNVDLDYDEWLNVMASVQHEAQGRPKAERELFYEVFRAWSAQSNKHDDATTKYKFFSFKNKETTRNRTMRSISSQVREIEIMNAFEESDDDDLIGDTPAAELSDDDMLGDGDTDEVTKRQQKLNKGAVEADLGHVPPRVKKLNKKHAVARVSGKTIIIDFMRDGKVSYGSPNDLHQYYENDRVATEKATEPVTKFWMRHKGRREYPNGIVFAPNRDVEGAYNHWQGFSTKPDPKGSCRLFLKHLRLVVCKDNVENYHYMLGWLAHMIQKPEDKPGVAVVFRGKKGTGKDTVGEYVGGLFPHHHITIGNQDQLTGKFNQHQEKCLLLQVEEGFWAGSKNAEGPLKYLITSPEVLIEPKGINAFMIKSVLRLMITSNERWVVPATADERRYFVLDVSEAHMQDEKYFLPLRHEMENGGRAALLDYLQNYNLEGFNVRNVPNTKALADQKIQGLRNVDLWWYGMLENGVIELGGKDGFGDDSDASKWMTDSVNVDRTEFREAYTKWFRSRRYQGDELRDSEIGKHMHAMLPSLGEKRAHIDGKRPWFYTIPPLERCRQEFEIYIKSEVTWPEHTITVVDEADEVLDDEFDDLI